MTGKASVWVTAQTLVTSPVLALLYLQRNPPDGLSERLGPLLTFSLMS